MIRFLDGPAEGVVLELQAAPQRLRVVRGQDGTWDALDQPEDAPRPDEEVFWYERQGSVGHGMMDYRDKSGRRHGRAFLVAQYKHAPKGGG